ncbi:hypothetical protein CLAFUR4_02159 [Fulvia fulva]|nr:hypothetical protein CLAFUR4_02159 [Fulvia fulva]KAK4638034.1 hypothetical protein CLAFUR0_02162 [Fulvia fulva]WPV23511.1 hypothetical protein CLAFUW7_02163 [Fulvia fulva]
MSSEDQGPADSPDVYKIPSVEQIRYLIMKNRGASTEQLLELFKQHGPYQDEIWAEQEYARRVDGTAGWNPAANTSRANIPRSKEYHEKMEAAEKEEQLAEGNRKQSENGEQHTAEGHEMTEGANAHDYGGNWEAWKLAVAREREKGSRADDDGVGR